MLAYSYLKENPKVNAKRMVQGLAGLHEDQNCPASVKIELAEIRKLGVAFNDSVLYFHEKISIDKLIHGRSAKRFYKGIWSYRNWLDAMYSYKELGGSEKNVMSLFYLLKKDMLSIPLTYKEIRAICDMPEAYSNDIWYCISKALTGSNAVHKFDRYKYSFEALFQYMSLDFIRRCTDDTIRSVLDRCRDVDKPVDEEHKYKSLNDLKRAHEARTEIYVKKLLLEEAKLIIYEDEFKRIVEVHGFKLPATKNDMIERSYRHHNCVATYADRHCVSPEDRANALYTRLVLDGAATAELNIEIEKDLIVAVRCPQYKGAYNKDIVRPLALTQLRIALTGLPVTVLTIKQVEAEGDKN